MKVSFKTLSNEIFEIDLEETDTVQQVIEKICTAKGFDATLVKLIFSGKILKPEQTVAESGVKEGSMVVCMVSKAKAATGTTAAGGGVSAPVSAPAPAPAPVSAPAPAPVASMPPAVPTTTTTTTTTAPAAAPDAAFEASVASLRELGFPEAEVRAALTAAKGNPNLAAEFLMTGIPPALAAGNNGAARAPAAAAGPVIPEGAVVGEGHPLSVLRSHPQFEELKAVIQSNPQQMPEVLASIGAENPELLTLINNNREAFIDMMQEPLLDDDEYMEGDEEDYGDDDDDMMGGEGGQGNMAALIGMLANLPEEQQRAIAAQMGVDPAALRAMAAGAAGAARGGPGAPAAGNRNVRTVTLSAEEMAAVERLCSMGFERQRVIQAYLLCDKNEELAANYLLENME